MPDIRPLGTIHEQDYYCSRVTVTFETEQGNYSRWNCYNPARYSRMVDDTLVRECEEHYTERDTAANPDPEPHMGDEEWDEAITDTEETLERDWSGNWWTL